MVYSKVVERKWNRAFKPLLFDFEHIASIPKRNRSDYAQQSSGHSIPRETSPTWSAIIFKRPSLHSGRCGRGRWIMFSTQPIVLTAVCLVMILSVAIRIANFEISLPTCNIADSVSAPPAEVSSPLKSLCPRVSDTCVLSGTNIQTTPFNI